MDLHGGWWVLTFSLAAMAGCEHVVLRQGILEHAHTLVRLLFMAFMLCFSRCAFGDDDEYDDDPRHDDLAVNSCCGEFW